VACDAADDSLCSQCDGTQVVSNNKCVNYIELTGLSITLKGLSDTTHYSYEITNLNFPKDFSQDISIKVGDTALESSCSFTSNKGDCSFIFSDKNSLNGKNVIIQNQNLTIDDDIYNLEQTTSIAIVICYDSCFSCEISGTADDQNCLSCDNSTYFFKENRTKNNCINKDSIGDKFFVDYESNLIKQCYYTCKTCNSLGTETNSTCLLCDTENKYYPKDVDLANCLPTQPENYYLYGEGDSKVYKQCSTKCNDCYGPANDENGTNCILCATGFYKKDNNSNTDCLGEKPTNYYLDTTKEPDLYLPCSDKCNGCYGPANDENGTNCILCATGFYKKDNNSNTDCLGEKPTNYYLDTTKEPDLYLPCSDKCNGCYGPANDENGTNCILCATGFYKKDSNTSTDCIDTKPAQNYYLDKEVNLFKECSEGCFTCNQSGIEGNSNCESCDNDQGFYIVEGEPESNCIHKNNKQSNYFVDYGNKTIKKCFSSCASCNELGTILETKCLSCLSNYTFAPNSTTHCVIPGKSNEYYDETLKKFEPCNEACKTCDKGGISGETNCLECNTGFHLVENSSTSNCVNNTSDDYYLNTTLDTFMKCYNSCSKCSGYGEESNSNCDSCKTGFYFVEGGKSKNCVEEPPGQNYYKNETHYLKCHEACLTCNGSGTNTNTNCILCNETDNYESKDGSGHCTKKGSIPGQYFDNVDNEYKDCKTACYYCFDGG
ncbi:MAG: hypothetical protein MJ231_08725, partial [bacterium]|nr:hypothetical protein [bacterium]